MFRMSQCLSLRAALAAAVVAVCSMSADAATLLNTYSVITRGSVTLNTSPRIHGRTLIGGSLTANNSAVFGAQSGTFSLPDDYALVVLGSLSAPGNYVNVDRGRVRYGGAAGTLHFNMNGATDPKIALISAADPFTSAELTQQLADLATLSADYAGMSPTATFQGSFAPNHQVNHFTIESTVGGVAVLNTSSTDLFSKNGLLLSNAASTDANYLVINVSGSIINQSGAFKFDSDVASSLAAFVQENNTTFASKLIWNFHEATEINLTGNAWLGTILAPNATLASGTGNIWGGLAVNTITGFNGEVYGLGDTPNVPPPSTGIPTPSAAAGGLALLAGAAMKRRR